MINRSDDFRSKKRAQILKDLIETRPTVVVPSSRVLIWTRTSSTKLGLADSDRVRFQSLKDYNEIKSQRIEKLSDRSKHLVELSPTPPRLSIIIVFWLGRKIGTFGGRWTSESGMMTKSYENQIR